MKSVTKWLLIFVLVSIYGVAVVYTGLLAFAYTPNVFNAFLAEDSN